MSGLRTGVLLALAAVAACGGSSLGGRDTDGGDAAVQALEGGGDDDGAAPLDGAYGDRDGVAGDGSSDGATEPGRADGGIGSPFDAAALCPTEPPQATATNPGAVKCSGQVSWQVCAYPTWLCEHRYQCQCIEGLGGPATCTWIPYGQETCDDAGDAGD